jgi:hypothetical protein
MSATSRKPFSATDVAVVIATLLVLSLGLVQRYRIGPAPDAVPYMQNVQRAAAGVIAGESASSGSLVSAESKVPRAAYDLLSPNVLMSRQYRDLSTNRSFGTVLVHCGDGRDMFAHYPPVCYVGNGYRLLSSTPMPLAMSDGSILPGIEYQFEFGRVDGPPPMRIWNVILMADDVRVSNMDEMRKRVFTSNARFYGAGQLQLIVSADYSEAERRATYAQALALYEPAVRAMLARTHSGTTSPRE